MWEGITIVEQDSGATIQLDPRIYSRETLVKAAYWHSATAFIHIPESPNDKFIVSVRLKHPSPTLEIPKPITIQEFVGEFCNSLLDFELRKQVAAETAGVRELIIAKAFSESGVLEE